MNETMNSPKTSKLASMASALVMAAVLGAGTVQAQTPSPYQQVCIDA